MTYQIKEIESAWKDYINSGQVTKTPCKWEPNRLKSNLTGQHHYLYAVLRGRDLLRTFTPVTRETKLNNGFEPYGALRDLHNRTQYSLKRTLDTLSSGSKAVYLEEQMRDYPNSRTESQRERFITTCENMWDSATREGEELLRPFDGTVNLKDVYEIVSSIDISAVINDNCTLNKCSNY